MNQDVNKIIQFISNEVANLTIRLAVVMEENERLKEENKKLNEEQNAE